MRWLGRPVILCAVLCGLFLMHGAAPPAGGCHGGGAVLAGTAMPGMPALTMAEATPAAGRAAAAPGPAGTTGTPILQAGNSVHPAAPAITAPSGAWADGMLCSSLPPRDALAAACLMVLASAAVVMMPPTRSRGAAVVRRPCRPPGRPGLPLPLFLGISRT